MAATQYAADTPLLVAGLVATGGLFRLWRLWVYGISFLMMGFVLGRAWRRAGVLTDAELVEIRYSGRGVPWLRALKAVYFGTIINCTVLAMVLVAASRIAEVFLPWDRWLPGTLYRPVLMLVQHVGMPLTAGAAHADPWVATTNNLVSILAILAFVALYSMTGGLRSVVATDVVQFAIAMAATLLYATFVVVHAGGFDALLERLQDLYGTAGAARVLRLSPPASDALMPFFVVLGLQWLFQMNSDGTGYLAQRMMACRSDRDAVHAGFVFTWAQVVARSLLWIPIAVGLLVLYPVTPAAVEHESFTAAREMLFATGIRDVLPAGATGLMLVGMLAALASTVDTHLNWGASYWSNDLYAGLLNERLLGRRPGTRELVVVARLSNLFVLAIALVIMTSLDSIQSAWHVSLLFGAGIGSVLVLRWLWERVNLAAEVAAIAVSLVVAPVLLVWVDAEWLKLALMALTSTLAVVAAAWWCPPTEPRVLDEFYRRVHPPGWWSQTARRAGEQAGAPRVRLRRSLALVAATGTTAYLSLIGMTRVMFPTPGTGRAWGLCILALALATVPLWWRRVTGDGGGSDGGTMAGPSEPRPLSLQRGDERNECTGAEVRRARSAPRTRSRRSWSSVRQSRSRAPGSGLLTAGNPRFARRSAKTS